MTTTMMGLLDRPQASHGARSRAARFGTLSDLESVLDASRPAHTAGDLLVSGGSGLGLRSTPSPATAMDWRAGDGDAVPHPAHVSANDFISPSEPVANYVRRWGDNVEEEEEEEAEETEGAESGGDLAGFGRGESDEVVVGGPAWSASFGSDAVAGGGDSGECWYDDGAAVGVSAMDATATRRPRLFLASVHRSPVFSSQRCSPAADRRNLDTLVESYMSF